MDYTFLIKLLSKNFTRFFPKTINRKLFRKYHIFFVPTKLSNLPKNFYPVTTNLRSQKDFIFEFDKNKKLINETTKKNLDKLPSNLTPWYLFPSEERKEFIISGHWSAIGIQAYENGITLDTGCVWGRKLSAYSFEDKKIISIDADSRDLF